MIQQGSYPHVTPLIGESPPMIQLRESMQRYGATDFPILICGESGSGKEVVAKQIHKISEKEGAFVSMNCGALPKDLLYSLLYGHERGAFTGAVERQLGFFEQANNGTLFLDEIGDLSHEGQVALLRLTENTVLKRLGGSSLISYKTRIIAASHRNLKRCCELSEFREDLFYRLHVLSLEVPPLRDRLEDIPLLVDYFFMESKLQRHLGREALQLLQEYEWPGNVRELQSVLGRAATYTCKGGYIRKEHISFD